MTATNITCQPKHRCLHVVTDAAYYPANGVITGFSDKALTVPRWPGVVTGRGNRLVLLDLNRALADTFATFDQAVDHAVTWVEKFLAPGSAYRSLSADLELIIAGWSTTRDQPESYLLHPLEENTLIRLPHAVAGPIVQDIEGNNPNLEKLKVEFCYTGVDVDADPLHVIDQMTRMIEIQRRMRFNHKGGIHYLVGGFATLTTITPDDVRQRILVRWPDKIGEKINPFSGMSRVKRDMLARKERKAKGARSE